VFGSFNHFEWLTIAYSQYGAALWTNRYSWSYNLDSSAHAIAVDGNGNILVAGWSVGINGTRDFALVSYSKNGAALCTNRYDGPAHGSDQVLTVRMVLCM
jgi:hypothetical protein